MCENDGYVILGSDETKTAEIEIYGIRFRCIFQ